MQQETPEETIAKIEERIRVLRASKNASIDKNARLEPLALLGRQALLDREQQIWDDIRTYFPDHKGWAANLAAHGWIVSVRDDTLYVSGRDTSYAVDLDGNKTTTDVPRNCANCAASSFRREIIEGQRTSHCKTFSQPVLNMHLCPSHVLHAPRQQTAG